MRHEESIYQAQVIRWLSLQYSKALFTGGFAGETMNIQRACRRKRMGYRAGTPDIFILEPKGGCHGLMVEMKSKTGTLSPEQKVFLAELEERGYATLVCHGFEEAVSGIKNYMEGNNGTQGN